MIFVLVEIILTTTLVVLFVRTYSLGMDNYKEGNLEDALYLWILAASAIICAIYILFCSSTLDMDGVKIL